MAKEKIKRAALELQQHIDALSGLSLEDRAEVLALLDTHRALPKAAGGVYSPDNYVVTDPVEHMKEHGTYRERNGDLDTIKAIIDDVEQVRKVALKVNNQLLAYERRVDSINEITEAWLKTERDRLVVELKNRELMLTKEVKRLAQDNALVKAALGVRSVGPVTVAYMLAYVDIEKARHASSLWSYAGLHRASHERYEKGVAGGGNKNLRTKLYTLAESQVKGRGAYREVYDNVKNRLAESEKVTKSRNTQGKLIECAWKDTKPSHRHGAALRAVMKHFLADWWYVARTLAGLPTDALYAEAMLGGNHRTIMPQERGWVW